MTIVSPSQAFNYPIMLFVTNSAKRRKKKKGQNVATFQIADDER